MQAKGRQVEPLLEILRAEVDAELAITPDLCLVSSGLIDSLRFASLLAALERRFNVRIDPQDVGADNFDSPRQMLAFLTARGATPR